MNEIENVMNQTDPDQILETLRPRMHDARVSHFRRLAAGVAVVPLLGVGVMAMSSADGPTSTEIETAVAPAEDDDVELPEIGDGETAEAEIAADDDAEETDGGETTEATTSTTTTTVALDPDAPKSIDLGVLGSVEVKAGGDAFEVVGQDLADGWEIINAEIVDGSLALLLANGETMKVVVIKPGPRDELLVTVNEFTPPTTTEKPAEEPKEESEPKEEPKAEEEKKHTEDEIAPDPVTARFTVEVPGKGSFVVERDGDTLYLGNVTVAEGYTYDIHKNQGWKVYVGFSNGETVYFGKALINDNGEVEQHFWEENIGPVPTYQWVEVPGVGAAKFEILEGQIRVYKTETAEGFESWDYNQGAFAATAKVDFEGEGQIWFIEASLNGNGELVANTYQG